MLSVLGVHGGTRMIAVRFFFIGVFPSRGLIGGISLNDFEQLVSQRASFTPVGVEKVKVEDGRPKISPQVSGRPTPGDSHHSSPLPIHSVVY